MRIALSKATQQVFAALKAALKAAPKAAPDPWLDELHLFQKENP